MRRFIPFLFLLASCGHDDAHSPIPKSCASFVGVDLMPTSGRVPCDGWLNALNAAECPALGLVWATFGDDYSCAARFLRENAHRPHLLRIHLTNETWRDDGKQGYEGDLFLQLTAEALNRALSRRDELVLRVLRERVGDISHWLADSRNPNTTVLLSTGLEDVYSDQAYQVVRSLISEQFAGIITRNPLSPHAESPDERHGSAATCDLNTFLVSEDGSVPDVGSSRAFLSRARSCLASFLWRPEHQGREVVGGHVTPASAPPRERTFTFKEDEMTQLLSEPGGPTP